MIGIINYGSGNYYVVANIYKRLNIKHVIVSTPDELNQCDKLVLPGVGAFDETMILLRKSGLKDKLMKDVNMEKKPIIGMCVGMQIMGESSEEGVENGFGWISGKIKKLDSSLLTSKPHLPHLGWNNIKLFKQHSLMQNIDQELGFYFLHNYYFDASDPDSILAVCNYGKDFPVIVNHENVFGLQFHPEKSHQNGVELFRNFANL